MSEVIKVYVSKWPGRDNLVMFYTDPLTRKKVVKTTGTEEPKDAQTKATLWEDQLRRGAYRPITKWTWEQAVDEFLETKSGKRKTEQAYHNALNSLRRLCGISDQSGVGKVDTSVLTTWKRKLSESKVSKATIASYLRHVRAFFNWAAEREIIAKSPKFSGLVPKQAKGEKAKGRPITLEEFERILAALPQILTQRVGGKGKWRNEPARPEVIASWERLLWGYWLSGLRLQEAIALKWDGDQDELHLVDDGDELSLWFAADSQKSGRSECVAITDEFEAFLRQTPESDRRGLVFRPLSKDGREVVVHHVAISKVIGAAGKKAKVVVKRYASEKVKYASAHDLRRTFCDRICHDLEDPASAIEFTRHANVATLMDYYVGRNAKQARARLRAARQRSVTNISTNTECQNLAGPQGFEP